jgi:hypothetical protein
VTVKIPSAEWTAFKTAVREAFNVEQERRLAVAHRLHAELKRAGVRSEREYVHARWEKRAPLAILTPEGARHVRSALFSDKTGALVVPKKKDFPPATTATHEYSAGDAVLLFDNDTRTVSFESANPADAEEAVVVGLFEALGAIGRRNAWTPGAGGSLQDPAGETRVYGTTKNQTNAAPSFRWTADRVYRDSR